LVRQCATSKNYAEFEEPTVNGRRPSEEKLLDGLQVLMKSAAGNATRDLQMRVSELSRNNLEDGRYAVPALLRDIWSGVVRILGGENPESEDVLRGMCAQIFALELAPIRQSVCGLDRLADLVVRTSGKVEGRVMMRALLAASDQVTANIVLERAHQRAIADDEFCSNAGFVSSAVHSTGVDAALDAFADAFVVVYSAHSNTVVPYGTVRYGTVRYLAHT
jgi:hypothetical protein